MGTVLLSIAKIIGIILLVLILLIIFLLLVVLFVPIRYRIRGNYDQKPEGDFHIHWLLHIISFKGIYSEEFFYTLRVFGIKIMDSRKVKEQKPQKLKIRKEKHLKESIKEEPDSPDISLSTEDDKLEEKAIISKDSNEKQQEDTEKKPFFVKAVIQKIKQFLWNIGFKFRSFCVKIKKLKEAKDYYIWVWNQESTKEAFQLAKDELIRILKHFKPKKMYLYLEYGDESVERTAKVMEVAGMLYPIFLEHVVVVPFFDEKRLYAKAHGKGRLTIFVFLYVLIKIYFNKNIRVLLEQLKREV